MFSQTEPGVSKELREIQSIHQGYSQSGVYFNPILLTQKTDERIQMVIEMFTSIIMDPQWG